jgi:hypothetical protein
MKKKLERKHFDRDAAFSMNLSNPNSPEEDAIRCMITLDDRLICFSEKSIKEILTAETIDPENENPETRHSYQAIYNIGTNNSFVARTIVQAEEILNFLILRKGLAKQKILDQVWVCSKLLLNCEESQHNIFTQTTELMHQCDAIINKHKEDSFIPQLPLVEDLEQHVVSFLGYAKRFLEASHKLFCIFYDSPDFKSNFKSYRDWIAKNKPDSKQLIKVLEQDKNWIQLIAWSRNALDANHSQPQFKVTIENFKIHKGNKFANPSWRYDFRAKNGGLQNDPSDIIVDMNIHMTNMLTFFEEIFLLCIQDNWDNSFNFQIYKHSDENINKKCPSLYFVSLELPS